jgi:hypothetical protein
VDINCYRDSKKQKERGERVTCISYFEGLIIYALMVLVFFMGYWAGKSEVKE